MPFCQGAFPSLIHTSSEKLRSHPWIDLLTNTSLPPRSIIPPNDSAPNYPTLYIMARSFSALPQNAKHIEPFKLSIADKDISDLQQLLRLSRIPSPSFENTQDDRRYGVTVNWLAQAKDYWLKQFNWYVQWPFCSSASEKASVTSIPC